MQTGFFEKNYSNKMPQHLTSQHTTRCTATTLLHFEHYAMVDVLSAVQVNVLNLQHYATIL